MLPISLQSALQYWTKSEYRLAGCVTNLFGLFERCFLLYLRYLCGVKGANIVFLKVFRKKNEE